ncbi:MAG TPA: helix-turn-helix domain-containing protein [Candidatus Methanoculleus thermohydrogenotrophicum]|jgi:predicted hydrocarbon binding protein|nr:V4R domain-containing protein [Candidatus Methanoculleus thermohydrogenotrophicum]NLM82415.1 helix-turn-helix domain-containing protein [Candidatus Methanoculleus thermohydrogenotrophicum]HOB18786.1 helix-turn-helix domain-containing protein [Candidatus Methanoculleus thermohydrogenotrophicum]HPZ38850.1 helix-turn-helix domain-containing protein [Candidatus Methanoculleus thermohydrogenotrophicum]
MNDGIDGKGKPGRPGPIREIDIYSTPEGARAVGNPVRRAILAALRQREHSFDEIVTLAGRAKSTVSVHLQELAAAGVIGSRTDPDDARRKIFFLTGDPVGSVSAENRIADALSAYVGAYYPGSADPFAFYKLIFRTIRVALMQEGILLDPLLTRAGEWVGEELYPAVADPATEVFCANIARFWEDHRLGRVEVAGTEPLTLLVYDCFECEDLPVTGRPACAFDSGILRALFSGHYGRPMVALETRCYSMGYDHCRFEVVPDGGGGEGIE